LSTSFKSGVDLFCTLQISIRIPAFDFADKNSFHSSQLSIGRPAAVRALRANIDETVPPVIITEQGENRNQCEELRNVVGFSHGFACR